MSENIEGLAESVAAELVESMRVQIHADRQRSIELLLSATLQIWFKEGKKRGIAEAGRQYTEALKLGEQQTSQ